ncbi:hypothetical protein [Pectobacterium phage Wc4-1]|uniref:Uncharacterized protein n=1 Tax=Pectobacterium phage Wc4 TaxID=2652428 RepID=A0A5P8D787_9CAUD|nr:hypothetical protein [Pectobacterium phage Wc4]QFP94045.1 hypothetical protein [Pectobacterium phage Wc4-1]
MKGQFEAGKLAMIIGAIREERRHEVGRIVKLICLSDKKETFSESGVFWTNSNGERAWVVSGNVTSSQGRQGVTFKSEKHLMLIEPPDDEEGVKEDEEELSTTSVH